MSDLTNIQRPDWYYSVGGQTYGPITHDAMVALIVGGTINAATWVMSDGMSDWIGADQSPLAVFLPSSDFPPSTNDALPPEVVSANEGISLATKPPRRWHKRAAIIGASLLVVLVIGARIAGEVNHYQHRRGNPSNAVYPIIGEPMDNLLTRFHEKKKHVEPADNGLTKLALTGSALNEGTFVYFLDNRVVAFRIIPLPSNMSEVEQRSRCTLEYAQVREGFIEGDCRVMETIKSEGNTLKDRLGHEIWFLPSPNGSLLVLDETVADKLGVQSIKFSTAAAPDESRMDATPTPPPAASQSANGQPAAVADQEVEIIRPYARFRVPRSYTFVRSFKNEAEDVVILARPGRTDGATVLVPDVQLSFCTDQKRFDEYVRYGSADVPENATLTAILNAFPQDNFNGNAVRIQQNIIGGKVRNISYQHSGTNGGVSFSFRLRTINPNRNDEQIDYSTLIKALKATLSLERHTDNETRANEASLSGKKALSARTALELNPIHKTLPELEEVWGKAKLAPAGKFEATDFHGLLPKKIQRRYFFDSLPDPFNEVEQAAAYFLDGDSTSFLMVFFGTHGMTEQRIIELLDHFAASGTWHRTSDGQWLNTQARLLALLNENTVMLFPSESFERQSNQRSSTAEPLDSPSSRLSTPINAPSVDASTPLQPKRRLARPGTLFLLQYASVKTNRGIYGFEPGHEVHLVREVSGNGTVIVSDGNSELEISPNLLTNDLDVAAQLARADATTQARIVSRLQSEKSAAEARQHELDVARARNVEAAEKQKTESSRVRVTPNPLDQ